MRISQISEGISNVLYHGTTLEGIASILDKDEIRMSPVITRGEVTMNKRKNAQFMYFLSTARTKMSDFTRYTEAIIRLDGRKLAQNYSGSPVDYFDNGPVDESEDRIYSHTPTIKQASRYITGIELAVHGSNTLDPTQSFIVQAAHRRGIPVKVYKYDTDMIANQKPWPEAKVQAAMHDAPSLPDKDDSEQDDDYTFNTASQVAAMVIKLLRGEGTPAELTVIRKTLPRGDFLMLISQFMRFGKDEARHEIMKYLKKNNIRSYEDLQDFIHTQIAARDVV